MTEGLAAEAWIISGGHARLVSGMKVTAQRGDGSTFDARVAKSRIEGEVAP